MSQDTEALLAEIARLRDAVEDAEAGEQDSEEEAKSAPTPAENSTIKAIRAEARRAEKRAAAAEAEAAELRTFKETALAAARDATLRAAGLTDAQAAVFSRAYDEATPENVAAFKSDVLGVSADAEDEGSVPSAPFAPAGFASEKPVKPITGTDAVRDFVAKHGVEAAEKAWRDGTLKL